MEALNKLAYYANYVATTKGFRHHSALIALRNYIRVTPEDELLRDIKETHRLVQLRALWEAGINATLQAAATARAEEIAARGT